MISAQGRAAGWRGRIGGRAGSRTAALAAWSLMLAPAALIVATLVWCLRHNTILSYADAPTHLNLARRAHDDLHPGLGQLGDYWLPLAHVLELPFVWNDTLWHTGLAGAIPSMGCYLLSTWCLYQLGRLATGQRIPGVIAAVAFAANPNILYLHVLPMFEPAIIASTLAATVLLAKWLQGGGFGLLVGAGAAVSIATTSRYEVWGFALASVAVVGVGLWQAGDRGSRFRDRLMLYVIPAWYGMALWVLWNLALSGDPFYFLHPSFNKGLGEARLAVLTKHQPTHALAYVSYSVADNAGPILVGLAALGLWRFVAAFGVRAKGLWLYLLATPAAFDVFYLWYKGTPPILVPELLPKTAGNIRYGTVTLPLLCLLIGYLARRPAIVVRGPARLARVLLVARRLTPSVWLVLQLGVLTAVLAQPLLLVRRHAVVSYNEANTPTYLADQQARVLVAHWIRDHYDGGRILMSTFKGADRIILDSGLPNRVFIHEGSQNDWRCARARPQRWVRWIVLFQRGDGAAALRGTRSVGDGKRDGDYFTRIKDANAGGPYYWIFRRNGRPWHPLHPRTCE